MYCIGKRADRILATAWRDQIEVATPSMCIPTPFQKVTTPRTKNRGGEYRATKQAKVFQFIYYVDQHVVHPFDCFYEIKYERLFQRKDPLRRGNKMLASVCFMLQLLLVVCL